MKYGRSHVRAGLLALASLPVTAAHALEIPLDFREFNLELGMAHASRDELILEEYFPIFTMVSGWIAVPSDASVLKFCWELQSRKVGQREPQFAYLMVYLNNDPWEYEAPVAWYSDSVYYPGERESGLVRLPLDGAPGETAKVWFVMSVQNDPGQWDAWARIHAACVSVPDQGSTPVLALLAGSALWWCRRRQG